MTTKNFFRKIKIVGGSYYNPANKTYEFKNYRLVMLNIGDVYDDKGVRQANIKIENEVTTLDECSDMVLFENYYKKTWENIADNFNENVIWEIKNGI